MVFNKLDDDLLQKTNGLKHESFLNLQMVQNQSAFMLYKTIVSKQSFFLSAIGHTFLLQKQQSFTKGFWLCRSLVICIFIDS